MPQAPSPLILVTMLVKADRTEALDGMEPKAAAVCSAWLESLLTSLEELDSLVDDADDAAYALAMRYTAIKATWIEYNTILNYQLVKVGESDATLMQLAGILARSLGNIEPHLQTSAVASITRVLADPIKG